MRILMRLLAPLVFWIAYGLFRASPGKRSPKKHDFVMKVFRFAADNNSRRALSMYGHLLHFRGDGVQNRVQGVIYLKRAAEMGDAKAQYQMGRIYEQGYEQAYKPDPVVALAFYRQAAERGHPLATRRLYDVYENGELGEVVDAERSDYWQKRLP